MIALFAFIISTTHDFFSVAKEGADSVLVPGTAEYNMFVVS